MSKSSSYKCWALFVKSNKIDLAKQWLEEIKTTRRNQMQSHMEMWDMTLLD